MGRLYRLREHIYANDKKPFEREVNAVWER